MSIIGLISLCFTCFCIGFTISNLVWMNKYDELTEKFYKLVNK